MPDQHYHLGNIRKLLTNAFSEEELRNLCFDLPDFRPVYDNISDSAGKSKIVAKLLEHAERNLIIDTLLALAKEQKPRRYKKHQPYYESDPTENLQKQVATLARRLSVIETDPETIRAIAQAKADARAIELTLEAQALQTFNRLQQAHISNVTSELKEAGISDEVIGTIVHQIISSDSRTP